MALKFITMIDDAGSTVSVPPDRVELLGKGWRRADGSAKPAPKTAPASKPDDKKPAQPDKAGEA